MTPLIPALAFAAAIVATMAGPAFAQGKTAAQLLEEYQQRQRELAGLGGQPPQPPRPPDRPGPQQPIARPCPPGQMSLLGVCSQMGR